MNLTAGPIPSANSTGAPYIAANFAPLKRADRDDSSARSRAVRLPRRLGSRRECGIGRRLSFKMATFNTRDDVTIYFKDWGPRDGAVVILSHGWPLIADTGRRKPSISRPTASASSPTIGAATAVHPNRGTATTWITTPMTLRS